MCGRYTLAHSTKQILERFQAQQLGIDLQPRYNIAPSQTVPIIVVGDPDAKYREPGSAGSQAASDHRNLIEVQWGLVPFWVKDLKKQKPMINARAEGLAAKPSFKNALVKRRCLIPADGFYEWKKLGEAKRPIRIHLKGDKLFAFAGLYEDWKRPDGSILRTCAIITVAVNEKLSEVHDRMPAILTPEDENKWLDKKLDPHNACDLLKPYADEEVDFYAVSNLVNRPQVDSEECAKPLTPEPA